MSNCSNGTVMKGGIISGQSFVSQYCAGRPNHLLESSDKMNSMERNFKIFQS